MTSREVALQVLRDVFPPAGGAAPRGAQEALDYRLQKAGLETRERAFATMLSFGATKMRRTLDWYLQPYLGTRDKALPPVIAEIVRLGAYELRYSASAQHAIVSEWVNLAKRYGHRGTAGLVNAVLRGMQRDNPAPPRRADFESDDEYLGVAFSFPTWLVRQFRATFGDDRLEPILEACNAPAQTAIVVDRAKTTRETIASWFAQHGSEAAQSAIAEDALLVSDGALARNGERTSEGAWWVQSETSAAVVDVLNPQPGESVADVCSGRGSKALQIAARLHGDGTFVCVDRDARKLQALQHRSEAAGFTIATVTGDATQPILPQRFDRVLIDAPCSALGVLGRHPEARWRKQPDDGERLARTQGALVEALSAQLYDGGVLVYAVCSTDPRETTGVIEPIVRANRLHRGLIPAALQPFQTDDGDVLIPPGIAGRDGFFIARLERTL